MTLSYSLGSPAHVTAEGVTLAVEIAGSEVAVHFTCESLTLAKHLASAMNRQIRAHEAMIRRAFAALTEQGIPFWPSDEPGVYTVGVAKDFFWMPTTGRWSKITRPASGAIPDGTTVKTLIAAIKESTP